METEADILKAQIKALKELVEIKDKTITELQTRSIQYVYIQSPSIVQPYYQSPNQWQPYIVTTGSNTTSLGLAAQEVLKEYQYASNKESFEKSIRT